MKTYCKRMDIDRKLVSDAFREWCGSEAGHKNRWRVEAEYGNADELIDEIGKEIAERTIKLRPIRRYIRIEPTNGKTRTIGVESIKQQVLDYVAVIALKEMLEDKTGFYQVSSVPGKGQLYAARTMRRWVQEGGYWVHIDIRKCYPSISHDVVMDILNKYVRSDDVLYICRTLLGTYGNGLEIGSYFSLRMAQLVLSFAYHYIEGLHKVRRGRRVSLVRHQLWYMDDAYLMSHDKRDLRKAVRMVSRYLRDMLGLSIKGWKICKVSDDEPIDVAGFVVRARRTTIRAGIFIRARRSMRKFTRKPSLRLARRVCSYWGWLKNSDSHGFLARTEAAYVLSHARSMISSYDRKVRQI